MADEIDGLSVIDDPEEVTRRLARANIQVRAPAPPKHDPFLPPGKHKKHIYMSGKRCIVCDARKEKK